MTADSCKELAGQICEHDLLNVTGTQLFAIARGIKVRYGEARCFFCGGATAPHTPAATAIRKSFTAFARVAQGEYVCDGCLAAFDEDATVTLIDGTVREHQRVRNYSWIITQEYALAATKAHKQQLREFLLNPPPSIPYVVSISDAGQAHFLYLTQPTVSGSASVAYLDGEPIVYSTQELRLILDLCAELIEVFGKTRIAEALSLSALAPKLNAITDPERLAILWEQWQRLRGRPAASLALWLS